MSIPPELRTDRLRLRRWVESDRLPFAAMNADPRVTEYLAAQLTREESDAMVARIAAHFDQRGFGLWAVEIPGVVSFAGFVGLPRNVRSRRVMERIGMTYGPDDDFDHPALPETHPHRRHVLYKISRTALSGPSSLS